MTRKTVVCDGCGAEMPANAKGNCAVGSIRLWVVTGRADLYVVANADRRPSIGSDFCSIKCLAAKVDREIKHANEEV